MKRDFIGKRINAIIYEHRLSYTNELSLGDIALHTLFDIYGAIYRYVCLVSVGREYIIVEIDRSNLLFIGQLAGLAEKAFPLKARPVFRDHDIIREITADAWRENALFNSTAGNGIVKMTFAADCARLPMHVHPLSARILLVTGGHGIGHYSLREPGHAGPGNIRSKRIGEGSLVFFKMNTLQTISTNTMPLKILAYHAPFFEFDDDSGFRKLSDWYPPHFNG
jgi:hypothetical protein